MDDAMGVKLLYTFGNLSEYQKKLSMISFDPKVLTQVILVELLGKGDMVVAEISLLDADDKLESIHSCHLADLIFFLHSLIDFRFIKHILDEVVLVYNFIFNLCVDGPLFLYMNWTLHTPFVSEVFEEG